MSEIKSTLDLVMEKTRDLNLSREERDAQRTEDIRKTLRGMIQKYGDRVLRKDPFLEEFRRLDTIDHLSTEQILRTELLGQIDLAQDPEAHVAQLELLQWVCGLKVDGLETVLREFAEQQARVESDRSRELRDTLQTDLNISGSAVVPNLEMDAILQEDLHELQKTYQSRLEAEKTSLQG